MCLICVDFQRQKLTPLEATRALGEMREKIGDEHAREVEALIKKGPDPEEESDQSNP